MNGDSAPVTAAALLTCCGFPMVFREIFGVRVYACVYRDHDRIYEKGGQRVSEAALSVHDQDRAWQEVPG